MTILSDKPDPAGRPQAIGDRLLRLAAAVTAVVTLIALVAIATVSHHAGEDTGVPWMLAGLAVAALGLVLVTALVVRRSVVEPLGDITSATLAVAAGDTRTAIPHTARGDEIGALAGAIDELEHTLRDNQLLDAHWIAVAEQRAEMIDGLRLRSQQLDTALNNMAHGVLGLDASMRLVLCNDRYLALYRLTRDSVAPGLPVDSLLRRQARVGTFPGDADAFVRWMAEGREAVGELELADGRIIRVTNRPLPVGGWVSTHEDITEQRRAWDGLARAQGFLAAVVETMPEALTVKNAGDLRYVLVNRAAETLYGVRRSAMLGRTAREVFPEDTADLIEAHDRALLAARGSVAVDEHAIATPGSGPRIVTARHVPINGPGGEPMFVLSLTEDRTSRVRQESRPDIRPLRRFSAAG
ncbi:MAG: PAS-domain containing protein [Rhodovulum sp.]|nr:PAS-domain containing protein [Rhodovulum sp.]